MTYAETTKVQAARDYLQACLDAMTPSTWGKGSLTSKGFLMVDRQRNPAVVHCAVGWLNSFTRGNNPHKGVKGAVKLAKLTLARVMVADQCSPFRVLATDPIETIEHAIIRYNDNPTTAYDDVRRCFEKAVKQLNVKLAGSDAAYREAQAIVEAELARLDADEAAVLQGV